VLVLRIRGNRATLVSAACEGLVPLYARTSQRIDSSNVASVVGPAYLQAFCRSAQSAADCQRLIFPFVDRIITGIGRLSTTSAFSQLCYNDNRVPISARAILHMQSVPPRSAMGL
jgi:hypothetical protein